MLRKLFFPKLLAAVLLLLFFAFELVAQDDPPTETPKPQFDSRGENRPNLWRELGLSPEQIQEIGQMNAERKPLMAAAQRRLREANRDLDIAIYADSVSDADFQIRLKKFHDAQAEVAGIRFTNELAVRKILSPEQLVRFRELRQRFAEARRNMERRRHDPEGRPSLRRMNRRQRQLPN